MSDLQVRGDVYAEDVKHSLNELARKTGQTTSQVIRDRAPMMARYLAAWTMPIARAGGGPSATEGKGARAAGEIAVRRDIGRVYRSAGAIREMIIQKVGAGKGEQVANAFSSYAKRNDLERAKKILLRSGVTGVELIMWDDGKRHKQARVNGNVRKGNAPVFVLNSKKLKKYKTDMNKRVGWTKAAWVNAGRQVAGRVDNKIQKWVYRHNASPATGQFKKLLIGAEARLTSGVPWVSRKIDDRKAMEAFDKSMWQYLKKTLQGIAKAEERKK